MYNTHTHACTPNHTHTHTHTHTLMGIFNEHQNKGQDGMGSFGITIAAFTIKTKSRLDHDNTTIDLPDVLSF